MIRFQRIRYKNFLSFGNAFTEIDFSRSPTTLVTGKNGAGKSTLLDAVTFVLYNKPFRKISKPQLVNSINRSGALVECEFTVGARCYMVRRGIKPNVFEIFESNTFENIDVQENLIHQDASSRDYQNILETDILKMNYDAFTQVVVLGKATYVPFMRLDSAKRRGVIEDLLGLKIFGTMAVIAKAHLKTKKSSLADVERDVDVVENDIAVRTKYIEKATSDHSERIKSIELEIAALESEITGRENDNATIANQIAEIRETLDDADYKTELNEKRGIKAKLEAKRSNLADDLRFYADNDDCPTCGQSLDGEHKHEHIATAEAKIQKIEAALVDINSIIEDLTNKNNSQAEIKRQIESMEGDIRVNNRFVADRKDYIEKFKAKIVQLNQSRDIEKEEGELVILTERLDSIKTIRSEIKTEMRYLASIVKMLTDDGIKTLIIRKYLPIFNEKINSFLGSLGFNVEFTLSDTFDEQILSRYRDDFSYNNFSEGQKLRIDLAIMLTWREVAKIKNSLDTNLLVLDEVFDSSLDQAGVDAFMEIMRGMAGVNIFTISHSPEKLADHFRSTIEFEHVDNFSCIKQ